MYQNYNGCAILAHRGHYESRNGLLNAQFSHCLFSLKLCQITGYQLSQNLHLSCDHLQPQIFDATSVYPSQSMSVYNSEIRHNLSWQDLTESPNLTML